MEKSILHWKTLIKILEKEFEGCLVFLYDSTDDAFVYKSNGFNQLEGVLSQARNRFCSDKDRIGSKKIIDFCVEDYCVVTECLPDNIYFGVCFQGTNKEAKKIKKEKIINLISSHKNK